MQIRSRLTVQFFVITAALLLTALLAIYFFSARIQKNQFYELLEARANTTADLLIRVEQVDSSLLKLIDLNKKDVLDFENISVYDHRKKEIYTNNDSIHFSSILPDLDTFLDEARNTGKKRTSLGRLDIIGLKYTNRNKTFVVVACAVDTDGISDLYNLRRVLTLVFIFILAVTGLAGWFYSGRALKPISNVINQVDNISAQDLSLRIDEGNKKDEIARLTITFNSLLHRIEQAFITQKTFVSNASHELRNPLTTITAQLEVTLLNQRTAEEYQNVLASILEDISRLNEMSHRLLTLARIENTESLPKKPVRVDDLLWEAKNEFLNQDKNYAVSLFIHGFPENDRIPEIEGNAELLKVCFLNLLDNGCKFSADHKVQVNLKMDNTVVHIEFADKGMGIEETEFENIFQPFYRGKNTAGITGYGIGLSMVKKIVTAHQGTINIESLIGSGTTVTLEFPLL